MFRPLARSHRRPYRRGTSFVLIVVVMISFAAAVGVAFTIFAGQAIRINASQKDAQGGGALPLLRAPEPDNTINRFFSALLFDVPDGDTGNPALDSEALTNALRGHSLARSMYGRDLAAEKALFDFLRARGGQPPQQGDTDYPQYQQLLNAVMRARAVPWAGVGTFHEGTPFGDRAEIVNYTQILPAPNATPFLFDPEYTRWRTLNGTGATATRTRLTDDFNPPGSPPRSYVGKHAGYSFPDLKDFFLGAVNPATGQVQIPSFHREWLWNTPIVVNVNGTQTTVLTTLDPQNPNWTNANGRMKTLRPRPLEHPRFPRVGPNADGTFTGDVQNWPGGYVFARDPNSPQNQPVFRYYARNDSLWMYLGSPPVQFGNRKVVPMVAPLIVPLDGLYNASVHGNLMGPALPPPNPLPNPPPPPILTHLSYGGIGPWEVNMTNVLGARDFDSVVRARGVPQQRSGSSSRSYDPYRVEPTAMGPLPSPLPLYAPVAWDSTQVTGLGYPGGVNLRGQPDFTGFQATNTAVAGHPSLFNPAEWASNTNPGRTYPLSDIKRLHLRYAFTPDWYDGSTLATTARSTLLGNTGSFVYATGMNTANSYRLDPVHTNRALFTAYQFGLDRPKMAPNFSNNHPALAIGTNALAPSKPGFVSQQVYPSPGIRGQITDFAGDARWVNAMAALGSVDLNRPLADYRLDADRNAALSPATVLNSNLADSDRRQLASDIFARFVAALGAGATVDPTTGAVNIVVPPTDRPQYDALRYLAQLAVNIVDFIDNDDVSTVFAWNRAANQPLGADFNNPDDVNLRVVFGVEKPRLVINEVYSEVVNDPNEPNPANGKAKGKGKGLAMNSGYVRFWVELLNPTNNPYPGTAPPTTGGPLGDGGVQVRYPNSFNPYQLEIARGGPGGADSLQQPDNVTGRLSGTVDIRYTFNTNEQNKQRVRPNNGQFPAPPATLDPSTGVLIVGPDVTPSDPPGQEFNPDTSTAPWDSMIKVTRPKAGGGANGPADAMEYDVPVGTLNTINLQNPNEPLRRNVVLLRRLANPYLRPSPSNPYITVDFMDHVPTNDGIYTGMGGGPGGGGTPLAIRTAHGKVQPYAGFSTPDVPGMGMGMGGLPTSSFPNSMVLEQRANNPGGPRHTFGRHNNASGSPPPPNAPSTFNPNPPSLGNPPNTETLMTPFDWLVHMDRPLINKIELFQVRDSAPHLVTQEFIRYNPAAAPPALVYDRGYGRWRQLGDGLARALEFLNTKSHVAGVAHGGRVPGQINLNVVPDRRIITGLFDYNPPPQGGNAFGPIMPNVWSGWMNSRSPIATVPTAANGGPPSGVAEITMPGQSFYDGTGGTNDPFLSFGAPAVNPGGGFAYTLGSNEDRTIVRRNPTDPNRLPYLYTGATAPGDTYTPPEALRKVMNNVTTVNHNYLVFLTISYFEIDFETISPTTGRADGIVDLGAGITMPRLAQEAFLYVPGDLRQKVVAVVDMSNMAMDPTTGAPVRPFFGALETTIRPGANVPLSATGVSIPNPNSPPPLVLGYGVEEQTITVTFDAQQQRYVTSNLSRPAWAGSLVSNARAGYPGVQGAAFDTNDAKYKAVIPYLQRVR